MSDLKIPDDWRLQKRTASMTRSYAFTSYDETRDFLDELADLSEETGYYPNVNFTRTQVNLSIEAEESELSDKEVQFAAAANDLFAQSNT